MRAGLHQFRHTLLGELLLLHFVGELPRDDGLDGGNRHFLADSSFVEPAFERRSDMRVLPAHDDTSFIRCRAIAKSSGVFFMKDGKVVTACRVAEKALAFFL